MQASSLPFSTNTNLNCVILSPLTQAVRSTVWHGLKRPTGGIIIKITIPSGYAGAPVWECGFSFRCSDCSDLTTALDLTGSDQETSSKMPVALLSCLDSNLNKLHTQ